MKNLLNFGVSDPLTLGMAHPVADRIETLGRARPTTRTSRCLAFSAMSVIAFASAPLSIAADESDQDSNPQAKATESRAKPEKIEGQVSFKMNEAINMIEVVESLEGLKFSVDLSDFQELDFSGTKAVVFSSDGGELNLSENLEFLEGVPEAVQEMLNSAVGSTKQIKIIRKGDTANWVSGEKIEGGHFILDDTIVDSRFEFFQSSDPLETARNQLERTKRQLETLSSNESVSFDLQNALRDIESAQKSIEEAESRLLDETE